MNLLPARFVNRRPAITRATERHGCAIDGSLMIIDRIVNFTGRVIDLSTGGALFRPRLTYLMYRRDVPVCVTLGEHEIFGRIMGTNALGFGVAFDEALDEAEFRAILALSSTQIERTERAS